MKNIEIVLSNRCNHSCIFCPSPNLPADDLGVETVKKLLRWAGRAGATGVYLGGGEPTLREDLEEVLSFARAEGYKKIRLLTNGMRLADAEYARSLCLAGANEFEISVKGWDAASHDRLSQMEGAYDCIISAVKNLMPHPVKVILTVLITTENASRLVDVVRAFAHLGVRTFMLWLVSLFDMDKERIGQLLPSLSTLSGPLADLFSLGEELGLDISTTQVPPCFLPAGHRNSYQNARELELMLVSKRSRFRLETSPSEGGVKPASCLECAEVDRCAGLRPDYVDIFGVGEIKPIPSHRKWKKKPLEV